MEVEFPTTTILFYGDIGSGKSSVLKAVEFGLFGTMGDLPASSLMRRGQNTASVELTFSIDGDRYTIYRELKKKVKDDKETISQPKGWLIENDNKVEYTTTELRTKILDLLNYSTTKYKAANKKCVDIFRYTVYTPQESIKDILQSDPAERFEILKDVLEIEKYENSIKNLENIKTDLSRQIRDIESKIDFIGSPEEEIPIIEKDIEEREKEIKKEMGIIKNQKGILDQEKKLLKSIQEEYTNYTNKISEIISKHEAIKGDKAMLEDNKKSIDEMADNIMKKQGEIGKLPKIEVSSEKNEQELEKEIESLQTQGEEISEKKVTNQNKLNDVEKLLKEGKCSLCGQAIHDKERFDEEFKNAKENVGEFEKKLKENKSLIEESKELLGKIREFEKISQKKKGILELIEGIKENQTTLIEANKKLSSRIEKTSNLIEDTLKSYGLKSIEETEVHKKSLEEKQNAQDEKVESLAEKITELEKELASHETKLDTTKEDLKNAKKAMELKESLKKQRENTSNMRIWANDQFPVLLKDIERTILATTASQFNQYFKEWFRALVEEENIDIQIDPEDFQPIVMVDGFESPFDDLSGGEKSALSLAYRLALNKVINTKHQDVKTKDLLILDEPTDGFSEAQVNKMQEVFDTLNMKQMIIISHERTLDSFVSQVFNFKKSNHQTKVTVENI